MLCFVVLSPFLFVAFAAASDPSSPCTSGTCTYQSGDGSSTAYSVLTINAESPTSLSDITGAAGWDITACDPYSVSPQDIRLVCTDPSKGCNHLFEGGEENTIVRLPDSCAGGPFARVVNSWIPDDQSLPYRLSKRQINAPVRALTLDFDFSQIPETNGKVYVTASATNSQAQRDALTQSAAKRSIISLRHVTRTSQANAVVREFIKASKKRSEPRGLFDWVSSAANSIGNAFNNAIGAVTGAANQVGDALHDAGNTVVDGAEDTTHAFASGVQEAARVVNDGLHNVGDSIGEVVDTASGAVEAFVHSLDSATSFNETISKDVHLVNIDQSFPVFTASLSCPAQGSTPGFDTSVSITASVKAKLDAEVGFIVTGSIVPPNIDDLAFTSILTGSINAAFDVKANLKGTFDTGSIPLLQTGLPGLSFPGILTVGPSISLNAQAKASLGITADVKVSTSFDLPQVNLVFPPSQGQSAAQVVPQDTPISIDVATSAELKGRAEVHLIPRLDIGVQILEGAAKTTVFLNVDGSAGVDFTLSASASATPVSGTEDQPAVSLDNVQTAFSGSVGADMGVSINAGATAALSSFFDQTVSVQLFSKTFPLFVQNFGNPTTKRSTIHSRDDPNGLLCPAAGEINIKQPILNVTAPAPQQ